MGHKYNITNAYIHRSTVNGIITEYSWTINGTYMRYLYIYIHIMEYSWTTNGLLMEYQRNISVNRI